jgi:hypothetical protein
MDDLDFLPIRFHFEGGFSYVGEHLQYVGGSIGMSHVEIDKISLPEIMGHLEDHVRRTDVMRLHWLRPGKLLANGLMLLFDDVSCQAMANHLTDSGVAEIYVEEVVVGTNSGFHDEADHAVEDKDLKSLRQVHRTPSKPIQSASTSATHGQDGDDNSEEGEDPEEILVGENSDTSDEEYHQPTDEDSSGEDEEAIQMREFAKEVRKNIKAKKLGVHGSQIGKMTAEDLVQEECNLEDEGEGDFGSSDEYSYGENSEGEAERWKSMENKYDSKAPVPRCSRQFKKALVKYGLRTNRHILFPKDEKNRVRAICSWEGCKWLIYGSKTSRSEWFKVVTFVDDHSCPPRRDNKLVTSPRIAKRYFQEIRDNPTWKVGLIKKAVLRDMLADVSYAKCKRAKSIVLKAALDSMKGEYSRVYDYQLELLRSNPGSTVVVCLNSDIVDKKVYEMFYVCLDACKKGFLVGCRRVIGLDGCWFKGACNGELLCAIGWDANNQMYPITWAAVEKETYDSWYWFLGMLQKDLNINEGGEGWVIISDQQKGLLKSVAELISNAEHRMCARHIYANWRKIYTDKELQKKYGGGLQKHLARSSSTIIGPCLLRILLKEQRTCSILYQKTIAGLS